MSPASGRVGRRICDERSHPYAADDSTNIQRDNYNRIPEGEICDTDIQGLYAGKTELYGRYFWVPGYCVSTVGLDEQMIREYIDNQEREEKR